MITITVKQLAGIFDDINNGKYSEQTAKAKAAGRCRWSENGRCSLSGRVCSGSGTDTQTCGDA